MIFSILGRAAFWWLSAHVDEGIFSINFEGFLKREAIRVQKPFWFREQSANPA